MSGVTKIGWAALVLGIALFITYILSGILAGFLIGFLNLSVFLGEFAVWVNMVIQIFCMGLVALVVLKYVK